MTREELSEGLIIDQGSPYPKTSYAMTAIPRALGQGFSARATTCINQGLIYRWSQASKTPHYCLTEGVILQNADRISNMQGEHSSEEFQLSSADIAAYNRHYWNQLIEKQNVPLPILRVDDPLQVFYEHNDGIMPQEIGGINTVEYLTGQASNWEEVVNELEEHREEFETLLESGSIAYMTNHSSWPNIPFLVAAMHKVYGVPLSRFHILLGPALTTFEQGLELARIGNVIKTIPPTPNGQLPDELKDLERKITTRSNKAIQSVLKSVGNILIYCPFGTTDKKNKETGELVLDALDDRVLKFQQVINMMAPVIPVGTYDLEAFDGAKILTPGRVNIRFGKTYSKKTIRGEQAQLGVCHNLARHITNYEGETVGKLRLPTVEVIGSQGQFGAALTHVLKGHAVDKTFDVLGVTRQEAQSQEKRDRPEVLIITAPSWAKEAILNYIRKNPNSTIVLTAKGPNAIDLYENELTPSEQKRIIILSGPNKADQIKNDEPSAAVIAGSDPERLERVHQLLNGPNFRLYKSESPNVIQISGVLKNLIVLELGKVWKRLKKQPEQKAALIIQALEAAYSIVKKHAPENENPEEFWGIAGLGDILLCLKFFENSEGSRNFQYGQKVAKGTKTLEKIQKKLGTVEGIETSQRFHAQDEWLETPEIETFRQSLANITEGLLPKIEPREHSPITATFATIFSKLEAICRKRNFTENTRAWAFCRIHREMQLAFPEIHKKDILHAMCTAVLERGLEDKQTELDLRFPDIDEKQTPLLKAFLDLETQDIESVMKQVLDRNTKTEGFKKDKKEVE